MSASIKDVALKSGVSTATVSHVINGTRYVADETKKKVYDAMKELDYHPNPIARSLRSRKSYVIGLLVPILASDASKFFFTSVAYGIERKLKEHGYHLSLSNSNESLEHEIEQIKVFNSQYIDGLIIASSASEYDQLKDVISDDYPTVFIDRMPKGFQGDVVLSDNFQGSYDAISHLVKSGHKRIGFITESVWITTNYDRLEGYKSALIDHGIAFNDNLIQQCESKNVAGYALEKGYELAKHLVEKEKVTALFLADNAMTMGAFRYLQNNNIKMPDDVALVGFDDYEWTLVTSPTISVVKQNTLQIGEQAINLLMDRIENGEKSKGKEVRLATEFIKRGSV